MGECRADFDEGREQLTEVNITTGWTNCDNIGNRVMTIEELCVDIVENKAILSTVVRYEWVKYSYKGDYIDLRRLFHTKVAVIVVYG